MEATGYYWLSLYSYLINLGFTVYAINPIQSDAFHKMYISQTKNDSKDSFTIAQIMRFVEFSSSFFVDENIMALRQLFRYQLALVDESSDWKRKCIALLDQGFLEYSKLFSDTFGATSKVLLSKYPLPEGMISVDTEILVKLISKASKGHFSINKALEIKEKALNTFGVSFAKNDFSFQIKQIISQISSFD